MNKLRVLDVCAISIVALLLVLTLVITFTIVYPMMMSPEHFFPPDEHGIVMPVSGEVVGIDEKHNGDISKLESVKTPQVRVGEIFLGVAHAKIDDGTGTFTVRFQSGIKCDGTYTLSKLTDDGDGVFKCTDGDKGSAYFVFSRHYESGKGFGNTEKGRQFKFTLGGDLSHGG